MSFHSCRTSTSIKPYFFSFRLNCSNAILTVPCMNPKWRKLFLAVISMKKVQLPLWGHKCLKQVVMDISTLKRIKEGRLRLGEPRTEGWGKPAYPVSCNAGRPYRRKGMPEENSCQIALARMLKLPGSRLGICPESVTIQGCSVCPVVCGGFKNYMKIRHYKVFADNSAALRGMFPIWKGCQLKFN